MAAFNSMANRLTNILMTIENYNEENNFIVEFGQNNGYKDQEIWNIIQKHEARQRTLDLTTHLLEPEKLSTGYMSVPYYPYYQKITPTYPRFNNSSLRTWKIIHQIHVCTILSKNHEYFVEDFKKTQHPTNNNQ
jgi:hypothetical protein